MNNVIVAMIGFYTGVGISLSVAIVVTWRELRDMQRRHQARKPRLMAVYNSQA